MRIVYTKHALNYKFSRLKESGFPITERMVISAIKHPDQVDQMTDPPKIIASRAIDDKHVLRVVYRIENDRIVVITFYPARKGRYYVQNESSIQ